VRVKEEVDGREIGNRAWVVEVDLGCEGEFDGTERVCIRVFSTSNGVTVGRQGLTKVSSMTTLQLQ
jgi:hypothetical protein